MQFAIISLLTTLVCTAFTSASPAVFGSGDIAKRAKLESIPQIITNATNELQAPLSTLAALTPATATSDAVTSELVSIDTILTDAVELAILLVGEPIDIITLSVEETVIDAVSDISAIVSTLVSSIVSTFSSVESGGVSLGAEVATIDSTLASLISETTTLVEGLITDLTPIVTVLEFEIEEVGMTATALALGLV